MTFELFGVGASSIMTVVSLATFLGILWWTFGVKDGADFDEAAFLPFADEDLDGESDHG